jgi:hypothetical protein
MVALELLGVGIVLRSRRQKREEWPRRTAIQFIPALTRQRRVAPQRTRTIACPTRTTIIPIHITAYTTSLPCRLTFQVTAHQR